jgi:hypothetical protein
MSGPYLRLISSSAVNGALVASTSVCTPDVGASFTSIDGRSSAKTSWSGLVGRVRGVVSWVLFMRATLGRAWDGTLAPGERGVPKQESFVPPLLPTLAPLKGFKAALHYAVYQPVGQPPSELAESLQIFQVLGASRRALHHAQVVEAAHAYERTVNGALDRAGIELGV